MNFLERMGLVERTDKKEAEVTFDEDHSPECTEEIEVNTDNVSQESLVEDIYKFNDLIDTSKSIFKVEEIKASLPTTMTTEAMKTTVAGILSSFGLTVEELASDATQRITVLKTACTNMVKDGETMITNAKVQIEDAKKLIETYEIEIEALERAIEHTNEIIGAEVKRITDLSVFLGGNQNA